ncbi:MAG: adenylate/guanylate cyclase domain-containing protein [Bacteroidota bacterium]
MYPSLRSGVLTLYLLVCGTTSLFAQVDTLFLDSALTFQKIGTYFEALVDSQEQLSLEEARNMEGYLPLDSLTMPLPLAHRLWARAVVHNRTSVTQTALLYLGVSDSTVVYIRNQQGEKETRMGKLVPSKERSLPYGWTDEVKVVFPAGEVTELQVLVQERMGTGPSIEPIWEPYWKGIAGYLMDYLIPIVIMGLFCGGVTITMIYNLILWVSLRKRAYLFYSGYLACILTMIFFAMARQLFQHLGFDSPNLNALLEGVGLNCTALFYLLFGRSFLDSAQVTPKWDRVLKFLIGVRLALLGLILVMYVINVSDSTFLDTTLGVWYGIEILVVLAYLVRVARLRSAVGWFFVAGSLLVFVGGFGLLVVNAFFGWIADNGVPLVTSLTLEIIVFSLGLGYKMRQQQQAKLDAELALNQELQKINTAFGRFVPHAFLESLGHQSVLDVKLGDQVEKEVTVLFSDIRSYTTLAEGMTPQENFNFLNAYLGRMGPIIQAHDGFVNQYYGDGIMALFMGKPEDAVAAAVEMQQELARYNEDRLEKGRTAIRIGIGLHTGPLMMGIIGDTLRLEAGVVSDTVNTAARMEGLTKHFGVTVLLSEATQINLPAPVQEELRILGKVQVKGRVQPLRVYQAFAGELPADRDLQSQLSPRFAKALEHYFEGEFAHAVQLLEELHAIAPNEPLVQRYLEKSRQMLQETVAESWTGVEVMERK